MEYGCVITPTEIVIKRPRNSVRVRKSTHPYHYEAIADLENYYSAMIEEAKRMATTAVRSMIPRNVADSIEQSVKPDHQYSDYVRILMMNNVYRSSVHADSVSEIRSRLLNNTINDIDNWFEDKIDDIIKEGPGTWIVRVFETGDY